MAVDFKHPKEQAAWKSLTENPVFQFVVDGFQSAYTDLTAFANLKTRNFLVTEDTMPRLHRLFQTAARRLGLEARIPVYVKFDYDLQIETVGTDKDCAIVISSACLEECSDGQLLAMFGRELTHIRYGHIRMLNIHNLLDSVLPLIPMVGSAAAQLFKTLLLQWRQYACYTADRGSAIAAQSTDAALEALSAPMGMKLDSTAISAEPEQDADGGQSADMGIAGKAILQLMLRRIPVPFGAWRLRELKSWCESSECADRFPAVYYTNRGKLSPALRRDTGSLYRSAMLTQPQDPEAALVMLHTAAEGGSHQAQAQLGQYYLTGKAGLPTNVYAGLDYMRQAARQGSVSAWFGLGVCLRSGLGNILAKDEAQALWMFRLAEAGGHPKAAAYLAACRPQPLSRSLTHQVMHWFAAGFREGPCRIDTTDPAGGMGDVSNATRTFLWIPAGETVLALEHKSDAAGALRSAIAVTPIGIYYREEAGDPRHLTWETLRRCQMDGAVKNDTVTLRIDGAPLCAYRKDSPCREAGMLILRIRRLLQPGK